MQSGLDQKALTGRAVCFRGHQPARRFAAAAPGVARLGMTVFRGHGTLGCRRGRASGTGTTATCRFGRTERGSKLCQSDIVLTHRADDVGDHRLALLGVQCLFLLLQLADFFSILAFRAENCWRAM